MKITRQGSYRNDGPTSISLEPLSVGWDGETAAITLSCPYVRDFGRSKSTYDYVIRLSLNELGSLLEKLTEGLPPESVEPLRTGLGPRLRSIIRLAVFCVAGEKALEE